jgi:hypothetical protein
MSHQAREEGRQLCTTSILPYLHLRPTVAWSAARRPGVDGRRGGAVLVHVGVGLDCVVLKDLQHVRVPDL